MTKKVYELKINEDVENSEVHSIALVEEPAIEIDFIAFSKDDVLTENCNFSLNDERKELLGAAMIPDIRIPRKMNDEVVDVFFSKETIRQIAQVYFKKGYQHNTNIGHSAIPADSYVFQSYIVDSERGINAPKGMDLPDGTWVVGVKVESESTWQGIKDGKIKGFSIEMTKAQIEQKFSVEKTFNPLEELQAINKNIDQLLKSKKHNEY